MEEEVEEELHGLKFNRWLMAVQCALAPLFCVAILFGGFLLSVDELCVSDRRAGGVVARAISAPLAETLYSLKELKK